MHTHVILSVQKLENKNHGEVLPFPKDRRATKHSTMEDTGFTLLHGLLTKDSVNLKALFTPWDTDSGHADHL